MGNPRILVIQHDLDDHLNELAEPLLRAGMDLDPWYPYGSPAPARDVESYAGIVSLGAEASVNDDLAWQPAERAVMAYALDRGVPLLGICFGAQLLASVAGARVYPTSTPEVGWTRVAMDPAAAADPVLSALGHAPQVFQFHHDTFDLPPGAALLGRTGELNQAFRVGPSAWGVQFHIEVGAGAVYSWLATSGEAMIRAGVDLAQLREVTTDYLEQYRRLGHALGAAFAAQVTASSAGR